MCGVLKTVCLFLTLCFYNYLYDETIEVSVSSEVFRLLLQKLLFFVAVFVNW